MKWELRSFLPECLQAVALLLVPSLAEPGVCTESLRTLSYLKDSYFIRDTLNAPCLYGGELWAFLRYLIIEKEVPKCLFSSRILHYVAQHFQFPILENFCTLKLQGLI